MSISVVVLTYNQERHVEQTVRSFADQVTDEPVEIIVSDDASRDGTPDVLRRLAEEYPNLTLLLHPDNAGITGNCNRGLEAATGDFIVLTGGDDIALPGRLAAQAAALRANPTAGACVTATEAFDSDTGATLRTIDPATAHRRTRFEARDYVTLGNIGATPAYMYRRGIAPDRFDTTLPIASDAVFNIETAHRSWVLALPTVYMRYRVHGDAASSTGHGSDRFVTEGILAARYPDLVPYLGHWRARVYRTEALKRLIEGRPRDARPYFAESLKARPNLRSLAGLALCLLPEDAAKSLLYRYNPMLKTRYEG